MSLRRERLIFREGCPSYLLQAPFSINDSSLKNGAVGGDHFFKFQYVGSAGGGGRGGMNAQGQLVGRGLFIFPHP